MATHAGLGRKVAEGWKAGVQQEIRERRHRRVNLPTAWPVWLSMNKVSTSTAFVDDIRSRGRSIFFEANGRGNLMRRRRLYGFRH